MRGVVWLGLLVLSGLPVFWLGFHSLALAWSTPEYSQGPIIPLISLYLLLRELRHAPTAATLPRRGPGIALLLVALALGIFGDIVQIPDIVTYALILWVGALVLIGFGWAAGRRHWKPVLHLIFMLPLPQFVYWKMSIFLQLISSELGVWFLMQVHVPVYLEGNVIDLGTFKLQVAEACSGLRYLFPILSFSYLFSILYRGPLWHKAVLLVSAAPLTVVMNAVRIAVIGVLVDRYGTAQAQGFLHLFEGWVIFLICIALLFLLALLLQRLTRDPKPLADTIDLDFTGFGAELARLPAMAASRGLALAAVLGLTVATLFVTAPLPARVIPQRDSFSLFPRDLGAWSGMVEALDPSVERVLGADDYINATYATAGEAAPVNLFVAYYDKQAEGSGIHSPAVCLPSAGWEVSSIDPTAVDMTAAGFGMITVNRAVIQKGMTRQLVYYWFEQRGRHMTSDYLVKAYVVWDGLTRGRSDGAMVRLITPMDETEGEGAADARLQRFMGLALARLGRFVPG